MPSSISRRQILVGASAAGFGIVTNKLSRAAGFRSANDRPRVGVVGTGSRWDQRATIAKNRYGLGKEFPKFSDIIAVCDVDANRVERAKGLVKDWLKAEPTGTQDYRQVVDNKDVDIVHIVTPDHWHAKVAIEAMLAGKDVYCEKPMTLTIEEGQQICEVAKKTGRIMQVGTQQRSNRKMLTAVALVHAGRLGKLKRVQCAVGGGPTSPELPVAEAPKHFDWDRWQGPVDATEFRYKAGAPNEVNAWSRTHYDFRWWYEYSGGKLTDWGAHHVDIAVWGMQKTETGPVSINPILSEHPVEYVDGMPQVPNRYNTATKFLIQSTYADGLQLDIRHDTDNGILFEGTEGRIFVNRGRLTGKPVEDLASNPLPGNALKDIYKGREPTDHLTNFFTAVQDRKDPISDVYSHHKALSVCHLSAIAARLNRPLKWDPEKEAMVDDLQAQSFVARPKRAGYEIEM
ncbi:MAG: Gfo/Idh/MocA family oxidoreductase [Planctomycetota bacterium]